MNITKKQSFREAREAMLSDFSKDYMEVQFLIEDTKDQDEKEALRVLLEVLEQWVKAVEVPVK